MRPERLRVGGVVPFSTVDYPGRLSAVVFCQGCPWRCRYCHNTHLQPFTRGGVAWSSVADRIGQRRGFLDAVVFSGGEPTAQAALAGAMREVRAMGFEAALHTAGIFPGRLREVLPLASWVGLDIKAPFDARYDAITRVPGSFEAVRESLDAILAAGVPCELRTTVHPALLDAEACDAIREAVAGRGGPAVRWQAFRPEGCADEILLRQNGAA